MRRRILFARYGGSPGDPTVKTFFVDVHQKVYAEALRRLVSECDRLTKLPGRGVAGANAFCAMCSIALESLPTE